MSLQTVSHFELVEKLGEGGMGVVYKARDTRLDRLVAIKLLPQDRLADPERRERFIQEARTASALNHPNIVTVYDIDEAGGVCFIAMEYVPGKTLDQLIPRKGMRLNEALRIAVQAAGALAAAHAARIVHRDLKPGNLMVTENGQVKLLDFGLAKLTEPAAPAETDATRTIGKPHTLDGAVVGTAGYMSPEQAEGRPVDARSDIFSFGALLYEMVTGERAFRGDSNLSTLAAILHHDPKPASSLARSLPRELDRIIARCLRKEPARRFQTMADLEVALQELKEESESGKLAAPTEARRYRRRRILWAAAAAVLLLALAAGALLHFTGAFQPPPPIRIVPLTTYPGSEGAPALSPDGSAVAFSWDGPARDNLDIYILQIGAGGVPLRRTTDPAPDNVPAWSPDGRYLAFARGRGAWAWDIYIAPALGADERRLATVRTMVVRPHWSPDGRFLIVADSEGAGTRPGLFLLSIETGEKRRLTSPPEGSIGDSAGFILPKLNRLVFFRLEGLFAGDTYELTLGSGYSPTGEPRRLTEDRHFAGGFTPSPNGRDVLFVSSRDGSPALWRLRPGSSSPPEKVLAAGEIRQVSASVQGNRLVYASRFSDINIWRCDLEKGGPPAEFISSTKMDILPEYSPDGRRIAFVSNRSGQSELWIAGSDGAGQSQLTTLAAGLFTQPRWSPDGRRIAFSALQRGDWGIFTIDADGGHPQPLVAPSGGAPSWSRDGQWVYFSDGNVWKAPVAGGPPVQITRGGGFVPQESADGAYVYYAKRIDTETGHARRLDVGLASGVPNSIWRAPADGGEEVEIVPVIRSQENFAVTARGLYYIAPALASDYAIHFYDFKSGKANVVAIPARPPAAGLAVSPDGRHLLFAQRDRSGSDLVLVENFR